MLVEEKVEVPTLFCEPKWVRFINDYFVERKVDLMGNQAFGDFESQRQDWFRHLNVLSGKIVEFVVGRRIFQLTGCLAWSPGTRFRAAAELNPQNAATYLRQAEDEENFQKVFMSQHMNRPCPCNLAVYRDAGTSDLGHDLIVPVDAEFELASLSGTHGGHLSCEIKSSGNARARYFLLDNAAIQRYQKDQDHPDMFLAAVVMASDHFKSFVDGKTVAEPANKQAVDRLISDGAVVVLKGWLPRKSVYSIDEDGYERPGSRCTQEYKGSERMSKISPLQVDNMVCKYEQMNSGFGWLGFGGVS